MQAYCKAKMHSHSTALDMLKICARVIEFRHGTSSLQFLEMLKIKVQINKDLGNLE